MEIKFSRVTGLSSRFCVAKVEQKTERGAALWTFVSPGELPLFARYFLRSGSQPGNTGPVYGVVPELLCSTV